MKIFFPQEFNANLLELPKNVHKDIFILIKKEKLFRHVYLFYKKGKEE